MAHTRVGAQVRTDTFVIAIHIASRNDLRVHLNNGKMPNPIPCEDRRAIRTLCGRVSQSAAAP